MAIDYTKAALAAGFTAANAAKVTNFGQINARHVVGIDSRALAIKSTIQGEAIVLSATAYGATQFFDTNLYERFTNRINIETFKLMIQYNLLASPRDKLADIVIAISFNELQLEALKFLTKYNLISSGVLPAAKLYTTKTQFQKLQISYDHTQAIAIKTPDSYIETLDIKSTEWQDIVEMERELVNSDDQLISTTAAIFGTNATSLGEGLSSLETSNKTSIVNAINEIKWISDIAKNTSINAKASADIAIISIGKLSTLTTNNRSSTVSAINELNLKIDTVSTATGNTNNLNTDISKTTDLVTAFNSLFKQKTPILTGLCSNIDIAEDFISLLTKSFSCSLKSDLRLLSGTYTEKSNIATLECLEITSMIAKGIGSSIKTINTSNKTECIQTVPCAISNMNSGSLKDLLQTNGAYITEQVIAEICGQFDI